MATIGESFDNEGLKKLKRVKERAWVEKVKNAPHVEKEINPSKYEKVELELEKIEENKPYETSEELEEYLSESDKYKTKKLTNATIKMFEAAKNGVGVEPIKPKSEQLLEFTDDTTKIAASPKTKVKKGATIKPMKTGAPKTPSVIKPLENEKVVNNILKKIKEGDKFANNEEEVQVVSVNKKDNLITLMERTGKTPYNMAEFKTMLSSGELKTVDEAAREKKNTIQEIAQFIKEHGIDRVVVHGEPFYKENPETGEQEIKKAAQLDFDTKVALYFLNYGHEKFVYDKESGVADFKQRRSGERGASSIYNVGADTEFVNKGEATSEPTKSGSFVLHVDTGGKTLSIEKNGEVVMAFADHHASTDSIETSASDMILKIMEQARSYKIEPWMKDLVKFTNEVDNLSYANDPDFDPATFQTKWPKSLYALYEYLPYEKIVEVIKDGRDPENPFTEEELDNLKYKLERNADEANADGKKTGNKKVVSEELTIREIINKKIGQSVASSMKYLDDDKNSSLEKMKDQGIKTESALLGKVIFATKDDEKNAKGETVAGNYIKYGYLAAKAKGYDTFVSYNKQDDSFFVNSTTKDLRPIIAEIQKIVPGAKLVRGVMIVPGKDRASREKMTKEKLLVICGMLDKDTKLNTYTPKVEKRPSVIEFQKEKARLKLEDEIETLEERIQKKIREIELLKQDRKINEAHIADIEKDKIKSETAERELARVEENKILPVNIEDARNLPSTEPVKAEEALALYKGEGREAIDTMLGEFNEEKNKEAVEKIMQLLSKKDTGTQKEVENNLKKLRKRTYSKIDLANTGRVRDIAEANLRGAILRKASKKEIAELEAAAKVGQRIYNIIKKNQRS